MFKLSICRYSTRPHMTLDLPLRKTNTGQKSLSFLGTKIWSKIDPSMKNAKTLTSFTHTLKKHFTSFANRS